MKTTGVFAVAALFFVAARHGTMRNQPNGGPETVIVHNGPNILHALLWRPPGRGPFPAILFNHGSGRTREERERLGPYKGQAEVLGPVFARHGYVFMFLFRHGVGLPGDQGTSAVDLMNGELAAHGQDARNALQLRLLENREFADAAAGLAFLRRRNEVDARKVAIVGHSFGGSLTILQAERERNVQAVVIFSGAGYSWDRSPELRARLLSAVGQSQAPVFFIHAANDYSVNPGKALDARFGPAWETTSIKDLSGNRHHARRRAQFSLCWREHLGTRRVRLLRQVRAEVSLWRGKLTWGAVLRAAQLPHESYPSTISRIVD
jgi:carboxymethylenebutenolidase